MAFDEQLARRVRDSFVRRAVLFEEKRMMGGLCFMVDRCEASCLSILQRLPPGSH
ncbi:MAG: hypothetical protein JNL58_14800 [Planctomyces sp.]|nr:hypothetical protein [Planctomyces sp.]